MVYRNKFLKSVVEYQSMLYTMFARRKCGQECLNASVCTLIVFSASAHRTLTLAFQIGDAGAARLADALKSNRSLRGLSLYSNNVGDAGALALVDALQVR